MCLSCFKNVGILLRRLVWQTDCKNNHKYSPHSGDFTHCKVTLQLLSSEDGLFLYPSTWDSLVVCFGS